MEEDNGPGLLPIVEVDGKEYLVDVEQREFREFNNPGNVINMHSQQGRRIVKMSSGQQWRSHGLDKPPVHSRNDMIECSRCGNRTPAQT